MSWNVKQKRAPYAHCEWEKTHSALYEIMQFDFIAMNGHSIDGFLHANAFVLDLRLY